MQQALRSSQRVAAGPRNLASSGRRNIVRVRAAAVSEAISKTLNLSSECNPLLWAEPDPCKRSQDTDFASYKPNVAAFFPGQGAQTVGMAKDLVAEVPAAKEMFTKASEILGYDLLKVSTQSATYACEHCMWTLDQKFVACSVSQQPIFPSTRCSRVVNNRAAFYQAKSTLQALTGPEGQPSFKGKAGQGRAVPLLSAQKCSQPMWFAHIHPLLTGCRCAQRGRRRGWTARRSRSLPSMCPP